ncbi:hypothetical protein SLA2020_371230 [Shorea laevis]
MNSMFSSFDAFCAEFLGQKVRASFASSPSSGGSNLIRNRKAAEVENGGRKQEAKAEKKRQQAAPRYAVEFDGLNFFETLVSH